MVSVSDLHSTGCEFHFWPAAAGSLTTLGKLFTHMYVPLSPSSIIW